MNEVWLQITAGQGPAECAWAVVQVLERIRHDAASASLELRVLEIEPGPQPGTARSVLVALSGAGATSFAAGWRGTVQ